MSLAVERYLVASRFGFGRAPDDPVPADPRAWVAAQLDAPFAAPNPDPAPALPPLPPLPPPPAGTPLSPFDKRAMRELERLRFRADCAGRVNDALETRLPVRDRLAALWADHFTVSVRNGRVRRFAAAYLRDAIRPHVTGRFIDLLLAVMRHPAMLVYLDNAGSVGPHSPVGIARARGLNENLARESLELHTVTPRSGFTQADVTSYAAILTGWGIGGRATPPSFRFHPRAHEPGPKTLLGVSFPEGEEGGVQALVLLSRHPDTHRNIARRLLTHYVADDPSEPAIEQVAAILADTDGDLGAATRAVFAKPAAWVPGAKLRSPFDLAVGTGRALGLATAGPDHPFRRSLPDRLASLGQPLWGAPLPNGWPDQGSGWATPSDALLRADFAWAAAGAAGDAGPAGADPAALADATLGPLATRSLHAAIAGAGSRRDALALLFASPAFQRR